MKTQRFVLLAGLLASGIPLLPFVASSCASGETNNNTGGSGGGTTGGTGGGTTGGTGGGVTGGTGGSTGGTGGSGPCVVSGPMIADFETPDTNTGAGAAWYNDNPSCTKGAVYTYNDEMTGTTQTPVPETDFVTTPGGAGSSAYAACTSGTIAAGAYSETAKHWGAGLGAGFNSQGDAATGYTDLPYDAAANGFIGIKFMYKLTVSGTPPVRVNLATSSTSLGGVAGDYNHCGTTLAPKTDWSQKEIFFDQALPLAWAPDATTPTTCPLTPAQLASSLLAIQWQISSDATAPVTFELCIDDLQFIQ